MPRSSTGGGSAAPEPGRSGPDGQPHFGKIATSAIAVGIVALAVADGCGPGMDGRPPLHAVGPVPSWLAPPTVTPSGPATGTAAAPFDTVPSAVVDPAAQIFDPQQIVALLERPELATVKESVDRGAPKRAAEQLQQLLVQSPPPPAERPAYQYQIGLLFKRAGKPGPAAAAFDVAAAADWPLRDYARWMAAELHVQMGEPAKAIARLDAITPGAAPKDAAALVRARALASGDVDGAAVIWREYLARRPRPGGWQGIALRFVRALLNKPSMAHAEEAAVVASQVIYESPKGRGVAEARKLQAQAVAALPADRSKRFKQPEASDLMAKARALSESRQGREAIAAAKKIIKSLPDDSPSELACEAFLARGKGLASVKRYAEASDALGTAIERCAGHPRQVVALFLGGRHGLRAGHTAKARKRYAQLEQNFPAHRFADDARLHGATAARRLGDEAAATSMLLRMADDYPEGDMVDAGLFNLVRDRLDKGDWAGAIVPLERAVKVQYRGRPYYAEGRPHYFLARARLELGQTELGLAQLERVVRDFPLSYYMVLAYSRLARHDPMRADRVVQEALAAEPVGQFVIPDTPALHSPAFLRAVELVRQGDGRRATTELGTLGVRDATADPAVLWASAFLLARIEAPAQSHGLLRSNAGTWSQHYPAGVWRSIWEVAYPRPYAAIVTAQSQRFKVPQELIYGLMREESAFQPRVVSVANAYGLMQLILPTARAMARSLGLKPTAKTLKQPEINIPIGCHFLQVLLRKFPYNRILAVPGYNAGPGAPIRWVKKRPADDFDLFVERMPYKETRQYTKRVIRSMAAYSMLYGPGMSSPLLRLPLKVKP